VQLIYSGGMSTNLHVSQHLTISYQSCEGEPYSIQIFDICYSFPVTYIPPFYELHDCTSHLLSLCNSSVHGVGFIIGKGKGFHKKS